MKYVFPLLLVSIVSHFQTGITNADDRPNIVVILCDDLGYGDLECYGHPHIKTPHLNQLAAEGIRFTDFYSAAPVCSPSRVGLLTGRSPNRAGVYDWIPAGNTPQTDAREQVHMQRTEVTIPQLLKAAGYQTCMAGKWHCNSQFNTDTQPQPGDFGFDHWLGTQNNAGPSHENPINFVRNGAKIGKVEDYSCQFVVSEVVEWLTNVNRETPFFVYLPFHEPHEPVASPPELVKQYRSVSRTDDEAQFFANVANVDSAVGRLLASLDQMKLRENTLIVFTSDNGPETLNRYRNANRSYGQPGPLKGMKLHTHDAGFRVAGIMNWQGHLVPGQILSTPVSSLDLLPTFCNLANCKTPQAVSQDGVDILPVLQNKFFQRPKPLVWAYFNAINESRVAMRDGDWKVLAKLTSSSGESIPMLQNITTESLPVVKNATLTEFEIYNIAQDIGEATNLANTHPALLESLGGKLKTAYQELVTNSHVWTSVN